MCDTRDGMGWGFEEVEGGRKGRTVVFDQGRVHGEGWFEGENLLAVRFGGEGGVRRGWYSCCGLPFSGLEGEMRARWAVCAWM